MYDVLFLGYEIVRTADPVLLIASVAEGFKRGDEPTYS